MGEGYRVLIFYGFNLLTYTKYYKKIINKIIRVFGRIGFLDIQPKSDIPGVRVFVFRVFGYQVFSTNSGRVFGFMLTPKFCNVFPNHMVLKNIICQISNIDQLHCHLPSW